MSEPASFFFMHILPSNLEVFHSPATNIKDHDDWLPWFIESSGCTAILQKCLTILQLVILVKVKRIFMPNISTLIKKHR